jgi:hypothetical protein
MSDLAERLRGVSTRRDMFQDPDTLCSRELLAEAADEIERLRAALQRIANCDLEYAVAHRCYAKDALGTHQQLTQEPK